MEINYNSLESALVSALESTSFESCDHGTIQLALAYARAIDENPSQLEQLGPKYQTTLNALGLSPGGRAMQDKAGKVTNVGADDLSKLRNARRERFDWAN